MGSFKLLNLKSENHLKQKYVYKCMLTVKTFDK